MEDEISREHELSAFRESYRASLSDVLPNLDEMGEDLFTLHPVSLLVDERTFDELSPAELRVAKQEIYSFLDIDPLKKGIVHSVYVSEGSPNTEGAGKLNVRILNTNQPHLFLHELVYEDGVTQWAVGADVDI